MTGAFGPDATADRPAHGAALAFVLAANVLVFSGVTIMNVALPDAQAELGLSDGTRQWVITLYGLFFASLMIVGGRVADLAGLRRCLVGGLLGFGAASMLGGLASSAAMLLLARAAQGAAGAMVAATALALVSALFPRGAARARAFGALGVVMGIGTAGSFLVAGVFVELLSWRWCLLVNAPVVAVLALGVLRTVPEPTRDTDRRRVDVVGAVLVTAAAALVLTGLDRVGTLTWAHPVPIVTLALGVVALCLLVHRSRSARDPLIPPGLVADRVRAMALAAVCGGGFGMFAGMFVLGSFLQDVQHRSALVTGLAFIPFGLSATVTSRYLARVRDRLGTVPLLATGLALVAAALATFVLLRAESSWAATVPATVLLGAGGTVVMVAGADTVTRGAGRDSGVAGSLVNSVQQLGAAIGTAALAAVLVPAAAIGTGTAQIAGYGRAGIMGATVLLVLVVALPVLRARVAPTPPPQRSSRPTTPVPDQPRDRSST